MQKSFGISSLVVAIISIFIPVYGVYLTLISGALAAFSYSKGFPLGLSAIIINIINIFFASPSLDMLTAMSGHGMSIRTFYIVAQVIALSILVMINKKQTVAEKSLKPK
jgi:hypothetical protein